MARAEWSSRLGFILAAAGATVGLGSIWKFPYVVANNGGGAFLFIYFGFMLTLGLGLLMLELAIGRYAQSGAVSAFERLGGKAWSVVGYMGVLCGGFVLSFYNVVGGWTIGYLGKALDGSVMQTDMAALGQLFGAYVSNPALSLSTHAIFAAATLIIVLMGVQKGIERASKLMMPALFLLMLVLIIRALTLDNAMLGLTRFFTPDWSKVNGVMLIDALGLACFSLSVGAGCMLAYGSYLNKSARLASSALWITGLTSLTSLLVGLMIFPAIFAIMPDIKAIPAGPGLTYMAMPIVFSHLPFGQVFAALFFFLLLFAALTSSVSLLELVVVLPMEKWGWTRQKSALVCMSLIYALGIPAALSFGPWADLTYLGKNVFDWLDYLSSNVLLPLGGIGTALFAGWVIWPHIAQELGLKNVALTNALRLLACVIAPIAIAYIMIQQSGLI